MLARLLKNLTFVIAPGTSPETLDILRILQRQNEDLAPMLGRAIATARLGLPRVSVA